MIRLSLVLLLGIASLASASSKPPVVQVMRTLPADSAQSDVAADILPLEHGAIITGWTSRGTDRPDGFLVRVDEDGRQIWRRDLGGPAADLLFAVQPDGENGFVCVGFTASHGSGGTDGWAVRVDSAGAIEWEKTYGGVGDDRLTSLQPVAGGWMAAGEITRESNLDAWVLRFESDGRQIGSWVWGTDSVERAFGVEPMDDGGFVVVGSVGRGEAVDGLVMRLDSESREVWTRRLEGPRRQIAYHTRLHRDGSVLVTGYGYVDEKRDYDAQVIRLGPKGTVMYERALGDATVDRGVQSLILDDGSAIVVGYSRPRAGSDSDPAWMLTLRGIDGSGRPAWTTRHGRPGRESGRWIAGTAKRIWVVGQSATNTGGSAVFVMRLAAK